MSGIIGANRLTKPDVLLILFFLGFAGVFNFALDAVVHAGGWGTAGGVVVVQTNGVSGVRNSTDVQHMSIPLTQDGVYELTSGNVMEISDGQVRMLQADCRDQICVRQGYISHANETIVCLPNRVVVGITDGDTEIDAVSR